MGRPYPGPWSFKHHPWLKEMHDSNAEMNVGQKSAQMGYTETVLNRTFFNIDVKRIDCLYVLPSLSPDASVFSASRFDPALEMSPHLSKMFSDVKNLGHKRAGSTNLYVRGSRSRSALKSIPVGYIVLDEVDEMEQENIPLALERTAGQTEFQVWALSTPTIPEYGINKMFHESTQEHFFFKCPSCSRSTELIFPDCLEITAETLDDESIVNSYLKCKECKAKLHHETKCDWLASGHWVESRRSTVSRGFYINQLYSSAEKARPSLLARSFLLSQRDPAEEQEFYNSKLGVEHVVAGAGVTDDDLNRSIGNHRSMEPPVNGVLTMGIDVGRWLHYEIDQWSIPGNVNSSDLNARAIAKVIKYGKVQDFADIEELIKRYRVNACIIDALPERRASFDLASKFPGLVRCCFYGQGVSGKQISVSADEPTITVDRTSWLDMSLGRFRREGLIQLPYDINNEYRSHVKALVRIYRKDRQGNSFGVYVHGSNDDHYAHARNYAEIALPFALSMTQNKDITE